MSVLSTIINVELVHNKYGVTLFPILEVELSYDINYPNAFWSKVEELVDNSIKNLYRELNSTFKLDGPISLRMYVAYSDFEVYKDVAFDSIDETCFKMSTASLKQFKKDVEVFLKACYNNNILIPVVIRQELSVTVLTQDTFRLLCNVANYEQRRILINYALPVVMDISLTPKDGTPISYPDGLRQVKVIRDFKGSNVDYDEELIHNQIVSHLEYIFKSMKPLYNCELKVLVSYCVFGIESKNIYNNDTISVANDITKHIISEILKHKHGVNANTKFTQISSTMKGDN